MMKSLKDESGRVLEARKNRKHEMPHCYVRNTHTERNAIMQLEGIVSGRSHFEVLRHTMGVAECLKSC